MYFCRSQQFDEAVLQLSTLHPLQSIHFGMMMSFYGLIVTRSHAHCNLVESILSYVSRFKSSKPDLLFYYLHLLDYEEALPQFLCEPNVNLRVSLVGRVTADHISVNGLLRKHCGVDRLIDICKISAKKAYENGMTFIYFLDDGHC